MNRFRSRVITLQQQKERKTEGENKRLLLMTISANRPSFSL